MVGIGSSSVHAVAEVPFDPIRIATARCKGCGLCVEVCGPHALALEALAVNTLGYHPVVVTDADACTSCAKCARVCPEAAFTVYARPRRAR